MHACVSLKPVGLQVPHMQNQEIKMSPRVSFGSNFLFQNLTTGVSLVSHNLSWSARAAISCQPSATRSLV